MMRVFIDLWVVYYAMAIVWIVWAIVCNAPYSPVNKLTVWGWPFMVPYNLIRYRKVWR